MPFFRVGVISFNWTSRMPASLPGALVFHNRGLLRKCSFLPSHAAEVSSPSNLLESIVTPVRAHKVGR